MPQIFPTAELRRDLGQISREVSELKEMVADRRRERVLDQFRRELAYLRFETALIRRFYVDRKFNPNQPRVPAGSREGGQWTTEGSADTTRPSSESPARARRAEATSILSSQVMSDSTPDPIVSDAQYAQTQFNIDPSALTGVSTIDTTTKQLANTLARVKDTFESTSNLSPRTYGTAIHTAFARAVRAQGLPGIASSDVETTFGGDRYGAKDSVRTDVILRNDGGDVIAIYDVKTGEKGIEPKRAAELRIKAGVGNEVPIIQMSFPYGISRKNLILRKSFNVSTVLNYGH
jgi:hypothetical protein